MDIVHYWHNLVSPKELWNLVTGYPYWLIKSGLPYQYPKLLEQAKSEAIIIGGGISGALSAYHLINTGVDCLLVNGRTIG